MNVKLDVHTHTIASGHAYSTIQEMVKSAKEKGLEILGITDHGPQTKDSCGKTYFKSLYLVPPEIDGIRILMGCELNILDVNATFDLPDNVIETLDLRIAGIHQTFQKGTIEENTDCIIKTIQNPLIDIISHPADGCADLLFEPIVKAAKENHILLEINNSSLNPFREMPKAWDYNRQLVRLCKKYELMVIMGSDAHISYDVANYQFVTKLLAEENFPEQLVINDKPDLFLKFLKR